MATTTAAAPLARKARVFAAVAMPGIPAGTAGKVTFVEGFSWIRYWVRFDNGVVRGSIHRNKLATPEEWRRLEERRALGLPDDEEPASAAGADAAGGGGGEAVAAGATVNGVAIPANLLERSKDRRALLGK